MYLIPGQQQIPSISTEWAAHVNVLENPAVILFPLVTQPLAEMFLETYICRALYKSERFMIVFLQSNVLVFVANRVSIPQDLFTIFD